MFSNIKRENVNSGIVRNCVTIFKTSAIKFEMRMFLKLVMCFFIVLLK
jgi:hypothetical protein